MTRIRGPAKYLALLAALSGCGSPGTPVAQPPDPETGVRSEIDRLLAHSALESIVSGRAGAFTRQVALLAGDLSDAELERLVTAVRGAFAPEALRESVASFLMEEAPNPETVSQVLGWIDEGANAEVQRVVGDYDPPLTLQEYAQSLVDTPPDANRIRLVVEWAQARGTGDFFVLLEEALSEAAHSVWAEFRSEAATFTPARGPELESRLTDSFNASVVSFLRSHETVTDGVLRAATDEYKTDAGQWYAQAYSFSVARAIRAAGQRVVTELRSPGG